MYSKAHNLITLVKLALTAFCARAVDFIRLDGDAGPYAEALHRGVRLCYYGGEFMAPDYGQDFVAQWVRLRFC